MPNRKKVSLTIVCTAAKPLRKTDLMPAKPAEDAGGRHLHLCPPEQRK
jgi:hypothetical protein